MYKNIYTISFFVTNSCNLSCSYCYEHNKNNEFGSFDVVKKIIDKYFLKYPDNKFIIDFFGGEPFLNFKLIKDIVFYVKENYKNYKFSFSLSTNGTILNDEIKFFLIDNKKIFDIGLSLDGCKECHDINRNNSFKNIDLSWFVDNGIINSTKMTISKLSLSNLYNNLYFCEQLGLKVNCNLAFGLDWNKSDVIIFEKQLKKIVDYYLSKNRYESELPFCNLLDLDWLSKISLPHNERKRFCGAGVSMFAFDTIGNEYPCQMFAPISSNKIFNSNIKIYQDAIPRCESWDECNLCIYKNICRTCIGSNYINCGSLYKNDMRLCKFEKLRFKAMTYLATKIYKKDKLKKYSNSNEIINGLKIIFKQT